MAASNANPPRRHRRLVKTVGVFAWLMLCAVLCAVLLIAAVGFIGFLVMSLRHYGR